MCESVTARTSVPMTESAVTSCITGFLVIAAALGLDRLSANVCDKLCYITPGMLKRS